MKSVWSDFSLPSFEKLNGDIKTDVLIVGGGIAGLLIAHELKSRGVECVVAEAKRICDGTTKNTTAKITSQHGFIYSKLANTLGFEAAKKYLAANENAIAKYRELCSDIDCDFTDSDSYAFSQTSRAPIESELHTLELLSYGAEYAACDNLPLETAGAVKFVNQAQFNPIKFACAIAKDLKIYENTPVLEINGNTAITSGGKINADSIVIATHFPFINRRGFYFLKMYQQRSYVTAVETNAFDGMYVDGGGSGLSFRSYKDLLFIGSGSHRTGKSSGAWRDALNLVKRNLNGADVKYKWAAQDCITLDGVPYIGQYSKNTPHMYVATGFNKWGMTSAMVASDILADALCGNDNEYADIFSPSRSILKKQLAVNMVETASNLLRFSTPRCPHLGCALKWNKNERSWDCPCHGSRFDQSGSLIDNPATKGLKKE